jgi:hypothetical protein
VFIATAASLSAQSVPDSIRTDTVVVVPRPVSVQPVKVDTVLYIPEENKAAAAEVASPVDLEKHLTQPPTLALFKSMLVPGLGQLGNRKYFKAAMFAGLEGWMIIKVVGFSRDTREARDVYLQTSDDRERHTAYHIYDSKRKSRNKYVWFWGLTAFVSMFDAYVDAHLSGSPADHRNDKFSLDIQPSEQGGAKALVSYSF